MATAPLAAAVVDCETTVDCAAVVNRAAVVDCAAIVDRATVVVLVARAAHWANVSDPLSVSIAMRSGASVAASTMDSSVMVKLAGYGFFRDAA
ncbi:MAG: hypothetical protein ACREBE_24030 [bacterium]